MKKIKVESIMFFVIGLAMAIGIPVFEYDSFIQQPIASSFVWLCGVVSLIIGVKLIIDDIYE